MFLAAVSNQGGKDDTEVLRVKYSLTAPHEGIKPPTDCSLDLLTICATTTYVVVVGFGFGFGCGDFGCVNGESGDILPFILSVDLIVMIGTTVVVFLELDVSLLLLLLLLTFVVMFFTGYSGYSVDISIW